MAIPFLNNINLSDNELQNAKLHITGTAPTAAAGQIYFDSGDNLAKYYSNGTDTWVSLKEYSFSNGTFINLSTATAAYAKDVITADLSATGTANNTTYLRGDNTWSPISGISGTTYDLDSIQVGSDVAITLVGSDATIDTVTLVAGTNITLTDDGSANITIDAANPDQTVTLTGEVTGTGTTSITTTVADGVLDVANFNASAIVTEAEGIENNDNDTTLPTSAAVKAYVDASTVGGLIYQGGYNAATNTPDLDFTPILGIKKGWTFTVTANGLFFTEQVRVGDVLIAEVDAPTTLADWTTVQNNIDLASALQIGIGNVNIDGAGNKDGLSLAYASGTATVGLDINSLPNLSVAITSAVLERLRIPLYNNDTSSANERIDVGTLLSVASSRISKAYTISDTDTITYPFTLTDQNDVIIQLVDTVTNETVYADVDRISPTQATITFATTPTNSVRVLVQKIG
jgi:hypothetical protein